MSPWGGGSVGELFGVGEEAAAAAGELPLAGGVSAGAGDVAALDVALLLAGAVVGGVDEASTLASHHRGIEVIPPIPREGVASRGCLVACVVIPKARAPNGGHRIR